MYHESSIKYVILDPSEVNQYGFFGAITKPLDRKVEIKKIIAFFCTSDYQ